MQRIPWLLNTHLRGVGVTRAGLWAMRSSPGVVERPRRVFELGLQVRHRRLLHPLQCAHARQQRTSNREHLRDSFERKVCY